MPLANDADTAALVLRRLADSTKVVYDVETSGLNHWKNYPIGHVLTFGPRDEDSYYVPVRHAGGGNLFDHPGYPAAEHGWELNPFEQEMNQLMVGKTIIGHNLQFDLGFLPYLDTTQGQFVDTLVMAYLVNELRKSFSLEWCCVDEAVVPKRGDLLYKHLNDKLGVPAERPSMGHFWKTDPRDVVVWDYAVGDGVSTWQLHDKLESAIRSQQLDNVFEVERQLTPVLHRMHMRGVKVDKEQLCNVVEQTEEQYKKAKESIGDINVRSPSDVKGLLEKHGATDWPKTPKGAPSFPEWWLLTSDIGKKIVDARKYRTLLDSFLYPIALEKLVGDRVHSTYHQVKDEKFGTVTGRMSSTDPNLTALPGKRQGERGKFFRTIFVPDTAKFWTEADYKTCEIRIAAHYSQAKVWMDAFINGVDPHTAVSEALSIPRQHAKTINLGLMTGIGSTALAEDLGVDPEVGRRIVDRYFEGLPEVREFQKQAAAVFRRRGYVKTILGRRLRLDDERFAYRAVNRLTQGGNADLLKSRLVEMDEVARLFGADLLLNVHDSISWQTESETADAMMEKVMVGTAESKVRFNVPMEVDIGRGSNWGAATYAD